MPMRTYAALLTTRAPTMCHECCSCPYPPSCVLSSDYMGSSTGYIVALEDDAAATATATCTPSSKYASVSPPPQQLYRLPRSLLGIKPTHETSFLLRRALPTSLPSLVPSPPARSLSWKVGPVFTVQQYLPMSSLASNESNGASRSDLSEQLSRLLQPDRVVPSTNGLQCQRKGKRGALDKKHWGRQSADICTAVGIQDVLLYSTDYVCSPPFVWVSTQSSLELFATVQVGR